MLSARPSKKEKTFTGATESLIFYPPPADYFPPQAGQVCYYYSLLRMMQYHNQNYEVNIPECCKFIVQDLALSCANPSFGDEVDDVFRKHLTDKLIEKLDIACEDDGDPIETVEDFIDEYSHSQAMALLLGMRLAKAKFSDMSFDQLRHWLKKYGPMVFDGDFDLSVLASLTLQPKQIHENITAYIISSTQLNPVQHAILVVGCQETPNEGIFYIDPNYPDQLFAMPFAEFARRVIDSGNGLICHPVNQLKPIIVQKETPRLDEIELPAVSDTVASLFYLSSSNPKKRKFVNDESGEKEVLSQVKGC